MKGYSITAPKGIAPPQMSLTDTKHRLVFTPLGDRMRIAGMADLGWKDEHVDPKRLDVLMAAAKASFPAAADYDNSYNHWAGLRPMTPDSVPRLGRPHPALAYNLGHGMLGWTMAMGTGERLGEAGLAGGYLAGYYQLSRLCKAEPGSSKSACANGSSRKSHP